MIKNIIFVLKRNKYILQHMCLAFGANVLPYDITFIIAVAVTVVVSAAITTYTRLALSFFQHLQTTFY